jgi:hypothetical protein
VKDTLCGGWLALRLRSFTEDPFPFESPDLVSSFSCPSLDGGQSFAFRWTETMVQGVSRVHMVTGGDVWVGLLGRL